MVLDKSALAFACLLAGSWICIIALARNDIRILAISGLVVLAGVILAVIDDREVE